MRTAYERVLTRRMFPYISFRAPAASLSTGGRKCKAIMEFRALGPIELWSAGQQYDLGPARARCVLAILLLTPRTIVPAEALIDRLWDTRPPPKARESLSVYIARLRASLRQALGDSVRLAGRARGYVLDVDPEAVDLHQFRRLRRQADALTASGDYDHAASLLREADGLWRGQALAGIRGDWVARMRDSLEEERRAAILERVECELELGRHADLVGELRHLLAQYPLDETFIAHQMTALYWNGRPGDALSLYRETRSRLIDEQGTEPGPMLSELHQRILRRDPQLAVRLAGQHPGRVPRPDTLPPETGDFVGRSEELGLLTGEHGDTPRVSVIEGMPGVGKTALAVRAARVVSGQYPDGMLYLDFHTHDPGRPSLDPAEALHRLLRMLIVPATQIPDAIGERAALWQAQLSRRRAVVILDDAARHDQIRPLLPAAGRCLILITTRRRLPDLEGARTLTLDVLSVDDAITLFRRIAGPGRAQDKDQVATAVGLCGRLPLAIQLAAGRLAQDCPPSARRPDRGTVAVARSAWRRGRGKPGGDVCLRPVLPCAGTRPPAVLPATGREPLRLLSACRLPPPWAAAPSPRQKKPSLPCSIITCWREAQPVSSVSTTSSADTRPCAPRVMTPSRSSGRQSPGSLTTTCTQPIRLIGYFIRSGAGCPCRSPIRQPRARH